MGPPTLVGNTALPQPMVVIPLAIVARLQFLPESILRSRWAHDMGHELLFARLEVQRALGIEPRHVLRASAHVF